MIVMVDDGVRDSSLRTGWVPPERADRVLDAMARRVIEAAAVSEARLHPGLGFAEQVRAR
jgi:hypothetical protein